MRKFLFSLQACFLLCVTVAAFGFDLTNNEPLPAGEAFQFSAYMDTPTTAILEWNIAKGYFLYKDRVNVEILSPKSAQMGAFEKPSGLERHDPNIGYFQAYDDTLIFDIPITKLSKKNLSLLVRYQGCSEDNFCYPPTTLKVDLSPLTLHEKVFGTFYDESAAKTPEIKTNEQDKATLLLENHKLWLILLSFLGFGLLLSFTPCILPMIPILSGIILGHGKHITHKKAFFLSLTYVLSMSITYALAGMLTAYFGASIQVFFQNPWVISLFALLFFLLALALFGLYELRLPQAFEDKISALSNKQQSGHFYGVAVMGVLSTLIVSPCVTAPLVGALAYISNTGNMFLGGSALFMLGFGMGLPLILIGTFGAKLLPKTGAWMERVKYFFGLLFVGLSIWMLSRIIPGQITMILWAALLIITAVYLGLLRVTHENTLSKFSQGVGLILAVYGVLLMIGAALGNTNVLKPLARDSENHLTASSLQFHTIKTKEDIDDTIKNNPGKITFLDFYADWCLSCKELENHTFTNAEVKAKLANFQLLKADITSHDKIDRKLMKEFNVVAPPTLIFLNDKGEEIPNSRIVGAVPAKEFLQHLEEVGKQ